MSASNYHLYEWSWGELGEDADIVGLKQYLASVWSTRLATDAEAEYSSTDEYKDDIKRFRQGFIRFDGQSIGAKNYIGFIQYKGMQINIYPKVFEAAYPDPEGHQDMMMRNLLYWLSYSTRIKFPFSEVSFKEQRFQNLLEPFIFIFAEVTNKRLIQQPYQRFEEVTEQTSFLKGRLAMNEYINRSLVSGNFHQLYSTYDSFEYNNRFNQIVKYVSQLLLSFTENEHSIKRLQNILFLLDEVDDRICTIADCNTVVFNRMYEGWTTILNMCRMFLANNSIRNQDSKQPNYCFFVPMELIFEEFIAGFLKKELGSKYKVHPQKSDLYLVTNPQNVFNLQHDILLSDGSRDLIIDTKYKIRSKEDKQEIKGGVSQSDMYQMVSYAYRRGCKTAALIYPNSDDMFEEEILEFTVVNGSNQVESVTVRIAEVPFWVINPSEHMHKLKSALVKALDL